MFGFLLDSFFVLWFVRFHFFFDFINGFDHGILRGLLHLVQIFDLTSTFTHACILNDFTQCIYQIVDGLSHLKLVKHVTVFSSLLFFVFVLISLDTEKELTDNRIIMVSNNNHLEGLTQDFKLNNFPLISINILH